MLAPRASMILTQAHQAPRLTSTISPERAGGEVYRRVPPVHHGSFGSYAVVA
jgi:hypothetical protein